MEVLLSSTKATPFQVSTSNLAKLGCLFYLPLYTFLVLMAVED